MTHESVRPITGSTVAVRATGYRLRMDAGGIDQLALVPEAGDGTSVVPGRRTVVIALLVAVLVGAVLVAWSRAQPEERACSLAPVAAAPVQSSADAALDAWWAAGGAEQVRDWSSFGHVAPTDRLPARTELTQLGDASWEWRYLERSSVGIEVGPADGGGEATWAVVGVGQCAYGPFDTRGGA